MNSVLNMQDLNLALLVITSFILSSFADPYYMEDIRSIEATKEKNGTVYSHREFGQRPYRRNIYTSLRITDLDSPNSTHVVLVKFISPFEVFSGNGGDFCRNDILYMGSEGGQALLKRYCNNNIPELDVWSPHITDTNSFIFQFYSSNRGLRVSEQTQSYGFQLEYFVTELECNLSMFTEYSIVSLPDDDGWFRVECSQPGNTSVATSGEIRCVDSEWETACNTVSNMTTCCFNDSSQMPSTSLKPSTPADTESNSTTKAPVTTAAGKTTSSKPEINTVGTADRVVEENEDDIDIIIVAAIAGGVVVIVVIIIVVAVVCYKTRAKRVEDAGTITDEYITASTRKQSVSNNNTGSVELVNNDMYSA